MMHLRSDSAQVEMRKRVKELLDVILISAWHSELDQQNQNRSESHAQTIQHHPNILKDRNIKLKKITTAYFLT